MRDYGMQHEERLVELGRILRDRRIELELRRSDVARLAGVTPAYVARIEDAAPQPSGRRTRPSPDVVGRWTTALQMSATDRARALELTSHPLSVGQISSREQAVDGASRSAGESPEHPLVVELRTILREADAVGDAVVVERVLSPVFALLRDRFADGSVHR